MEQTNSSDLAQKKQVLKSYILGFFLSILTTGAAYVFATKQLTTEPLLTYCLLSFAFIQAGVQLVLFLHLGKEARPRWHFLIFLFMVSVVIILVAGSIWIMSHLNYNVMSHME